MGIRRRTNVRIAAAVAAAFAVFAALITIGWRRRRAHAEPTFTPITGSRRRRTTRVARLGARRASAEAWHRARRTFASAHQLRTAADVVEVLGEMKGALAKLGQMASYLDETMPAPMRDALATLQ